MRIRTLFQATGPILAALVPLTVFLYLRERPNWDPVIAVPLWHFYVVTPVSLLAAAAAMAVGITGYRLRNLQVTFLSLSFASMALIFTVHGLATPGFLLAPSRVPAVAAELSVMLTAFWLLMSALPTDHALVRILGRWQRHLVPAWVTFLVACGTVALLRPTVVHWIPVDQSPLRAGAAAFTIALATIAGYRYWQSYRYSRFPIQIDIAYSAGWLAVAQVIIVTGQIWRVSWWLYHFLLLAAVMFLVIGVIRQYGIGASAGAVVWGLLTADPVARLEAGISPSVRALVVATEARDPYTAGHNLRVAKAAVQLAAAMALAPEALRALAQGGIVHDVGKVGVPDRILNKPGLLDQDERAVIEQHPLVGYEMCKRLGFMQEELDVIRHHHERWDGTGYPDRLSGPQIPILARILAVADVYDAVTSERAYRRSWTHEAARDYVVANAGTQFDPTCVAVWARLNAAGPMTATPAVVAATPRSTVAAGNTLH